MIKIVHRHTISLKLLYFTQIINKNGKMEVYH